MKLLWVLILVGCANTTKPQKQLQPPEVVFEVPIVGFIAGLGSRSERHDDLHLVNVHAIVQIPTNTKKYIRFGFIHNADPLTIYILPEVARNPGRYRLTTWTKIFSYSERSTLVLFAYDKAFDSTIMSITNYSLKGYLVPRVPGYEVLSKDEIGSYNSIFWDKPTCNLPN